MFTRPGKSSYSSSALAASLAVAIQLCAPADALSAPVRTAVAACPPLATANGSSTNVGSITFADCAARERFETYVAFLERDPVRFASDLATLGQLEASEVHYHVTVCNTLGLSCGGSIATDGERILVTVSDRGGAIGETASLNCRFAHEFEHCRQFDDGEFGFQRSAETGLWFPVSYDIGDEVKAWSAQRGASVPGDMWRKTMGKPAEPTLLLRFAGAKTDGERAAILTKVSYPGLRSTQERNVVFPTNTGYCVGQLVRPQGARNFFGRVHGLCRD